MASGLSIVALGYYTLPIVAVLLHVSLGYWIYRNHWDRSGGKWFVLMLGVGSIETFGFWINLISPPGPLKRVLFYPIAFLAFASYVAWTVFAGKYTGTNFHRHWVIRTVFAVILGGFALLALLSPFENLLITNVEVIRQPIVYYTYDIEPGLGLIYLLIYGLSIYTDYKLIVYLLSTSSRSTRQLGLLILAAVSVVVITAASQAGLFPASELNHAPLATILFILFATLALFRFDLLSVQPVARNAVVENLRDPVVVLDEDGRIVDFNEASTRVWDDIGAHVGDPLGVACPTLTDVVSFPDAGEETAGQLTRQSADAERHYSVNVSQVSRGRDDRHWYSVLLRDVTVLERSRWQLRTQNERLDQVASTISHDLRNPIQVADGYVEMLDGMIDADGLDATEADEAREYLRKTSDTHGRMEAIIEDVLTIAREGKTVAETERVTLSAVAHDAWANVDTGEATLTVADDRTLRADRSKLLTIFENVVRNALDHGPDDVTVEVGATDDGFYVEDDGPGIPAEHADSVFEYGYTTTDEGTGLGLSIVETMAESHGWTVELATPGDGAGTTGTRFVFTGVGDSPVVDDHGPHPAT
ncbi:ATP-binding protein [Halorientalis pallida]|uniref:histidine kinase n=1 Tax=Halorientalis pallida TaxID=2479928 RepID=A0A498KUA5_9EURY|nr:ATP-binding protein [Halorientalis pallida]RXK48552.1 hypothetical protein EAF64_12805 [Halorientalis pallida]